jgi:hypothetical protein
VKHVSIALLVVVGCFAVACFYGDPDYGDTRFSCDADHPCPSGQDCVGGTCSGSSSGGPGVDCGSTNCDPGQQCCSEPGSAPICLEAGAACAGASATCDQTSDCDGTDLCCDTDSGPSCGAGACGTMQACVDVADCPAGVRNCCRFDPTRPWGYCYAIACGF